MQIALENMASTHMLVENIKIFARRLRLQPLNNAVETFPFDQQTIATSEARLIAWYAASAAFQIRTLIGGTDRLHQERFRIARANKATMLKINDCLLQLKRDAMALSPSSVTVDAFRIAYGEIAATADIAAANVASALRAASAIDELHAQAIKFLHSVQRTGTGI